MLPESFAQDPERLERFEREARVLASLSHPNIAGIFGLEDVDGKRFLVMEVAEGETLSDRIARGPSPSPTRSASPSRSPRPSRSPTRRASSTAT